MDERRNVAAQIQKGVQLDGGLGAAEMCPWEDGQAQVDGRGIECVDGIVQIEAQVLVRIQRAGNPNQGLSEVCIDAPIALLVGFGQSGA